MNHIDPAQKTIAKPIMIQGTASSAGKSLITAALCRIFHQDGYKVAPFKAQNMSNNSFVTRDGLEMGRAQVVQAYAAGVEPDVRMNPVLLKPSSDTGSQVVMKGKATFHLHAHDWRESREVLRSAVKECYQSLAEEYEVIVLEGAGSPAEINLKSGDIVNMGMAEMADAPVIIVGDIDRGGVFASLAGTMLLLDPEEKERVKGFLINKFRGDISLLEPGLKQLEEITGIAVLGVIPWIRHAIDEEDGVTERFDCKEYTKSDVDICVIRLPHISNYTDFIPLENIPGVTLRWCDRVETLGSPDCIILPGTKATIADLQLLKKSGLASGVVAFAQQGGLLLGVCGGFQMLGKKIHDPSHLECNIDCEDGLDLLDMATTFHSDKHTVQVTCGINGAETGLFSECCDILVDGYEIHMGRSDFGSKAVLCMQNRVDGSVIGISDSSGNITGTYLHGLFDSSALCTGVVNAIRVRKGLARLDAALVDRRLMMNADIDKLAKVVRESIDLGALYNMMGIEK